MIIDCRTFQEILTDYIEGAVSSEVRAACGGHRLICLECRAVYDEVLESIRLLRLVRAEEPAPSSLLAERVISATIPGEILSCEAFDHLIGQYFDGVIMAPDYREFQRHFEVCEKCSRLLAGIEEAIGCCQEIGQAEIETPAGLSRKIIGATTGKARGLIGGNHSPVRALGRDLATAFLRPLLSLDPDRVAAASLIIAAGVLLIVTRFGGLDGVATQADLVVSRGQVEVLRSGHEARESLGEITDSMSRIFAAPTLPKYPLPAGAVRTTYSPSQTLTKETVEEAVEETGRQTGRQK